MSDVYDDQDREWYISRIEQLEDAIGKAIDIAKMFYGEIGDMPDNDEGDYAVRNIEQAYEDLNALEDK